MGLLSDLLLGDLSQSFSIDEQRTAIRAQARKQSATNLNGTLTLYHFGAGPRITATKGRVLPYAQVLAGGVHTRADLTTAPGAPFSDSDNAFMLQPGAGVIFVLTHTFGAIAEVNYRRVFFKNDPDNETRLFTGVRIAFR